MQYAEPIFPYDRSELPQAKFLSGQSRQLPELVASHTGVVEYIYVAACDFPWLPKTQAVNESVSSTASHLTRGSERADKRQPLTEVLIPFLVTERPIANSD